MRLGVTLELPREEPSVPVVRHLLGGSLRKLGVSEECVSDIELAMTEACTNVLRHATSEDDSYEVRVGLSAGMCTIRILDTGHGFDYTTLVAAETSAETGRGIQLMEAVVDAIDFESRPEKGMIVRLVKELEISPGTPLGRLLERTPA